MVSPRVFSISKRLKFTGAQNLVRHNKLRAKTLQAKAQAIGIDSFARNDDGGSTEVDNEATSYIASVGVGSPATNCESWQQSAADYKIF